MSTIAIVIHRERSAAFDLATDGADWLVERGHDVRIDAADAHRIGRPELGCDGAALTVGTDLVVGVGGDGTILRAVDLAASDRIPVLGVNAGQLGYLATVEPTGFRMALKRFLAGAYQVEERMRLSVEVDRGGDVGRSNPSEGMSEGSPGAPATLGSVTAFALNEVVLERAELGHTIRLDVDLDGRPFTPYVADGLILATPTGSTAYALSVRGPIVSPTHRAIVLAPVAPHMLFDRSMVLEPSMRVTVRVDGHRTARLSIDGRDGGTLSSGESIHCTAAEVPARLVRFGPANFEDVLRAKFHLPDR